MSDIEPGRARKIVFGVLTVLLLGLLLELFSTVVLFVFGGALFTPERARGERDEVLRHASAHANLGPKPRRQPAEVDAQRDESPEVLHPFVGFVRDPTVPGVRFPLDELGFHASSPPDGDPLVVGVFGGSVAVGLSRSRRLVRELEKAVGRPVWIRGFALGGYKQPQQLMALNYVLALGEELDVVINLDGFNDVALAPIEFEQLGLFPAYPRQWSRRVANLPDVRGQRLIGEITFLEAGRARRVAWCDGPPLAWSPTCHLLWKVFDFRASRRLGELRGALAEESPSDRPYVALGPQVEHTRASLLESLVQLWGRSSEQMHQLCSARGLPYFHFLQPNQYDPGAKPLSREEKQKAVSDAQPWAATVPQAYPLLSAKGEELWRRGVAFHDMRQIFTGVEQTLYFDTCCHFNEKGMSRLAAAIARIVAAGLEDDPDAGQ